MTWISGTPRQTVNIEDVRDAVTYELASPWASAPAGAAMMVAAADAHDLEFPFGEMLAKVRALFTIRPASSWSRALRSKLWRSLRSAPPNRPASAPDTLDMERSGCERLQQEHVWGSHRVASGSGRRSVDAGRAKLRAAM